MPHIRSTRRPEGARPGGTRQLGARIPRAETSDFPGNAGQALLVRASRLYYLENHGQAEIARLLGISRPGVSRLLSRARRDGIVEIRIHDGEETSRREDLARSLGLREVLVAPGGTLEADQARASVGELAAQWLLSSLPPGASVGLTAGTTLAAFVRHVPPGTSLGLKIVPLVGALWDTGEDFDGSFLCQELRRRTGGTHLALSAPAVVSGAQLAASLRDEPRVRGVLAEYGTLGCAFLGVGRADPAHPLLRLAKRFSSAGRRKTHLPRSAVASVGCLFFDRQGRCCATELEERTIGIRAQELLRVPLRVGLACGREKAGAVRALARGGVINVLLADESLCAALEQQGKTP